MKPINCGFFSSNFGQNFCYDLTTSISTLASKWRIWIRQKIECSFGLHFRSFFITVKLSEWWREERWGIKNIQKEDELRSAINSFVSRSFSHVWSRIVVEEMIGKEQFPHAPHTYSPKLIQTPKYCYEGKVKPNFIWLLFKLWPNFRFYLIFLVSSFAIGFATRFLHKNSSDEQKEVWT